MNRNHMTVAALGSALLISAPAFAQQASGAIDAHASAGTTAAADTHADATATANTQTTQQAGMALPTATETRPATGNSEHDDVVGHLAVGYLGRNTMAYGFDENRATQQLAVYVIGVRYWLDSFMGLDLGLGLNMGGRSSDQTVGDTKTSASGPSPTAFMLHAGVPLALVSSRHYAFEIIPEANFGYAKVTQDQEVGPNGMTKQSGTHFDLGARAGAEIHFGFIGVPQLSLVGSIGLRFDYDKVSANYANDTSYKSGYWSLRTTLNENPWAIFTNSISAFYYF